MSAHGVGVFSATKSEHPMEGCTLVGVFRVLEQEMQEFGGLSMLSDYFLWSGHAQKRLCGSHDPVHLVFGAIWQEMLKIVYPPHSILSLHLPSSIKIKKALKRIKIKFKNVFHSRVP